MASKFIIFLVFAAAAQSSAAVEHSELEIKLSTIKNMGEKTILDLQAFVHAVFDGIHKKLSNASPCQLGDTKKTAVAKFREGYENTMKTLELIANNPGEIEKNSCEFRAKLDEAVILLWSTLDMTLCGDPHKDLAKVAEITEEVANLGKDIGNTLYGKIKKVVGTESKSITAAINEVQLLAMDNVDCAVRAIMTAMKFYVLAASAKSHEDFIRYSNAIDVQYKVTLLTKWAETNEQYSMSQYFAVYNFDGSIDNIEVFTKLAADAKKVIFPFRIILTTAAATRDAVNVSSQYFDNLEKNWNDLLKEAYTANLESIKSIPSGVTITVDEDAAIKALKDMAAGIRNAAEVTHGKDAFEVDDKIEHIKKGIIKNTSFAWEMIYAAMKETSKNFRLSRTAINEAWKEAKVDIKKLIETLFDALTGKLPVGHTMSDLEYIIIEKDAIRQFEIMRCMRLIAHLRQNGIEVPFASVYNDQLSGKSTSVY